jgi:hypothetical protein
MQSMSMKHKMLKDVAKVHELLDRKLLVLYLKWSFFKTLYCTSDTSVQLLDEVTSSFFRICAEVMRDDIILSICALTDPASARVQGMNRYNLTVVYLKTLIPKSDSELTQRVDEILHKAKKYWRAFRQHRNRRVGHYDFETTIKKSGSIVPNLEIEETDAALKFIADVLNTIQRYYKGSETTYDGGIIVTDGAKELLEFIQRKNDLEKYFNLKEFGENDNSHE